MTTTSTTLKHAAMAALLTLTLTIAVASAGTVTYNTDASTLTCGTAASCVQNTSQSVTIAGTFHLSYNEITGSVSTPSQISYGTLQESGTGAVSLAGIVLDLTIFSTPPGGTGSLPLGTLAGLVTGMASNASVGFAGPSVQIGQELYTVIQSEPLPPPSSDSGMSTLHGVVTQVSTPEPATGILLGMGLLVLAIRRGSVTLI